MVLSYEQALKDLQSYSNEIIRLRAALTKEQETIKILELQRNEAVASEIKLLSDLAAVGARREVQSLSRPTDVRALLAEAIKIIVPFAKMAGGYDRDYSPGDVICCKKRCDETRTLKVDHLWDARAFLERVRANANQNESDGLSANQTGGEDD